jgi:hypothetical protein
VLKQFAHILGKAEIFGACWSSRFNFMPDLTSARHLQLTKLAFLSIFAAVWASTKVDSYNYAMASSIGFRVSLQRLYLAN